MASIAGGAFVGALTGVTLLVENRSCSVSILGECVSLGALFGGLGSLVRDSPPSLLFLALNLNHDP